MQEIKIPEIEMIPIKDLKSDGKNPNKMTVAQEKALDENLKKYGFIVPIITNKDLLIADGEHRVDRAKVLGMKTVPVIRLLLKEVDRKILRQVLNKLRGQHDVRLDINEYNEILKETGIDEFVDLVGVERKYIEDILESQKEFPEEYLELQQIRDTAATDNMKVIKLNLTEKQKEIIQKKLKDDGKQMFQIIDYFVLVGE